MVDVWTLPAFDANDPLSTRELDHCRAVLSEDELARAVRFRFPHDAANFTLHRGRMRLLLGDALDCHPRDIRFAYNQFGKPLLPGSGLYFNLSHTSDLALLAFSQQVSVGIDLERLASDVDLVELARLNFAGSEYRMLTNLRDPEQQRDFFYRCWTAKEALLKGLGTGLSRSLSDFTITLDSSEPVLVSCTWNEAAVDEWQFSHLDLPSPFIATVAVHHNVSSPKAIRVHAWTNRYPEV